ncbi:MAG TPA: hypothetical protein VKD91_21920 [Pyrinomonadaceae bacterium]|nr:hypothetical protein [Pyrinomonadaceae bacterium]
MDPRTIDGNASLEEQQNTLNFTENTASVKTVSYVRADPASSHLNLATFEDVPQTQILPPLKLTEAAGGSDIWVSGVIKKVALSR